MIRKILLSVLAFVVLLAAVVIVRTFMFTSKSKAIEGQPAPKGKSEALDHLAEAISFRTVSHGDTSLFDSTQFIGFRKFLERTYPLAHQRLKREIVRQYSLLYTWEGTNKQLRPIVLMAHQDVVPVEEGTERIWTVDPFKATVKENFIWGRGVADDKINLISIMEGVEKLLSENFTPQRTIYLVFGHDEELNGLGAQSIAALLTSRNVQADLVLDEGGIVTREKIPGMGGRAVALLGTSEKGAMSVELRVEQNGGHSALPAEETAIDILTKAIRQIRENKFEPRFSPSSVDFANYLGPEMPFGQKVAFANLWLLEPVVFNLYEQSREGNAMIRTTIAPTIIQSGIKDNVIPTVAVATVNFRMLPGDSSSFILRHLREVINDPRVSLKIKEGWREATAVTSPESFGYQKVDTVIRRSYQGIVTAPFLMIAATDSRHFGSVSSNIVKFSPMIDPVGFHGIDERVSLESVDLCLWFFEQLLRQS